MIIVYLIHLYWPVDLLYKNLRLNMENKSLPYTVTIASHMRGHLDLKCS